MAGEIKVGDEFDVRVKVAENASVEGPFVSVFAVVHPGRSYPLLRETLVCSPLVTPDLGLSEGGQVARAEMQKSAEGDIIERNDIVKLLLTRLSYHHDSASAADYGRIEELTWLLNHYIQGIWA